MSGRIDIAKMAEATGLKPETCLDLIDSGWTWERGRNGPTRFVSPDRKDGASLAKGGLVSGVGPLVGDRPGTGFGPGPVLGFDPGLSPGAGAISIQHIGDPNETARGVADAIRRVREHQADMRSKDRP